MGWTLADLLAAVEGPDAPAEPVEGRWCLHCGDEVLADNVGDFCPQCTRDFARGYSVRQMTGRCANGAERDHGRLYHAVPLGSDRAACGAKPGRRSGWSMDRADTVTCWRCLAVRGIKNDG